MFPDGFESDREQARSQLPWRRTHRCFWWAAATRPTTTRLSQSHGHGKHGHNGRLGCRRLGCRRLERHHERDDRRSAGSGATSGGAAGTGAAGGSGGAGAGGAPDTTGTSDTGGAALAGRAVRPVTVWLASRTARSAASPPHPARRCRCVPLTATVGETAFRSATAPARGQRTALTNASTPATTSVDAVDRICSRLD